LALPASGRDGPTVEPDDPLAPEKCDSNSAPPLCWRHGAGLGLPLAGARASSAASRFAEGSTVRYELDSAREVAPGCIVAVGSATLDAPGGPLQGIHHSRSTLTVIEQGDRWAVAAFHNTVVQGRS
jgi:hypothetical protein